VVDAEEEMAHYLRLGTFHKTIVLPEPL